MLKIDSVTKIFRTGLFERNEKLVLDGVNIEVNRGEIVGLVGESGCGKSTLAKIALKLLEPTKGQVILDGVNITELKEQQFRGMRKNIQIIFQNPATSLNPKLTLYASLMEALAKANVPPAARKEYLKSIAETLSLPLDIFNRYPNQVSGGEVQRVALSRILSMNPKYLVLDEPTSMLDMSVQASILNLLKKKKYEHNLGILFISHDLDVVRAMCDKVIVMKMGKIVDAGGTKEVLENPRTLYTSSLAYS